MHSSYSNQSGQTRLPWLKEPPCFGMDVDVGTAFFFAFTLAVEAAFGAAFFLTGVPAAVVDPADVLRSLFFFVTEPVLVFRMEATSLSPVLSLLVMNHSPVPNDHLIMIISLISSLISSAALAAAAPASCTLQPCNIALR